jgi:hypothetical protein
MISYSLPDFTVALNFNLMFAQLMKQTPEMFFDDVRLTSLYGCFPSCIMNGGRAYVRDRYTDAQIDATFAAVEQAGLKTRLTFTNMLVTEEQFSDEYFNRILNVADSHDVEIIVYSDALDDYIASSHRFPRTLSTTRLITEPAEMNAALARYDMVVLNYNLNKDDLFLMQVSDPARLEVMPNELCNPGCPHRQSHYRHNSADQLANRVTPFRDCRHEGLGFTTRTADSPTLLGNDDVRRLNATYGIENFKIVGRGVTSALTMESYLYYLVRPEHRAGLGAALEQVIRKGGAGMADSAQ